MDWTREREQMLWRWRKTAELYSAMHTDTAEDYLKRASYLNVPDLILSAIASSSLLLAVGEKEPAVSWTATVSSVVSTVCKVTLKYLNYEASAKTHHDMAPQWSAMAIDLEEMLNRKRSSRGNASNFIQNVKKRYVALTKVSPSIPHRVSKNRAKDWEKLMERYADKFPDSSPEVSEVRPKADPKADPKASEEVQQTQERRRRKPEPSTFLRAHRDTTKEEETKTKEDRQPSPEHRVDVASDDEELEESDIELPEMVATLVGSPQIRTSKE